MPSYLYIYCGLCQLFIVIQVLALWRMAYFNKENQTETQVKKSTRVAQTLNQIKKFEQKEMVVFSVICLVVLAVCITTVCIEIGDKKAGTTTWLLEKLVELVTTFLINIALCIALVVTLKTFFTMLRTVSMRSDNISLLKAMLIVLAVSFFCRAVLLTVTIVVVQMIPPIG